MAKLNREPSAAGIALRSRLRSDGVLTREEIAYCRAHAIPLGYDCAQIGWVPLGCRDDFEDGADETLQTEVSMMRRERVLDVERLDEEFLALQKRPADRVLGAGREPESDRRDSCVVPAAFEYRRWRVSDAAAYRSIFDDERVWTQLPERYPGPFDDQLALQLIELANLGDHHEALAVDYRGQTVGQVRLIFNRSYSAVRIAEIAYVLRPDLWGRGLMTRILSDFTERSFKRHQLDFICAWIRPDHAASSRTAERAGYRRDRFVMEHELAMRVGRPGFVRYLRSSRAAPDLPSAARTQDAS